MSGAGIATVSPRRGTSDSKLVNRVRAGDEGAFEELYRRYNRRIASFARGIVRDEGRAEDVAQETFLSALRRLRATDSEIAFKSWIYEIARNAAIDSYRRTNRAEEVPMDSEELLPPSDRRRLVGTAVPESALVAKERLEHLRGALDELSETHHRILVMRELEGLSYREIGERLELTRPAVESTLFRARRRLEREYEELDTGRRCQSMRVVIARLSNGISSDREERRLARHARRCTACRKRARELGVEPIGRRRGIAARAAALLPLPAFLRRRISDGGATMTSGGQTAGGLGRLVDQGSQLTAAVSERAAALVAAAALAGAGGAMLAQVEPLGEHHHSKPEAAPPSAMPAPAAEWRMSPRQEPSRQRPRARSRSSDIRHQEAPTPSDSSQGGRVGGSAPQQGQQQQSGPPVPAPPSVKLPAAPGPAPSVDDSTTGTLPRVVRGLDSVGAPSSAPAVAIPRVDAATAQPAASVEEVKAAV
jgi:RNA polymerase sigma factor (sigma-70 family)